MSATPPNFPGTVSATPSAGTTPLKKRRGCGSLGSLGGAIVFVLAVIIFLNPWVLRMGERWTRRRRALPAPSTTRLKVNLLPCAAQKGEIAFRPF